VRQRQEHVPVGFRAQRVLHLPTELLDERVGVPGGELPAAFVLFPAVLLRLDRLDEVAVVDGAAAAAAVLIARFGQRVCEVALDVLGK